MQAGTIVRGLVFWIGLTILLSVRPLRGQETEVLNNDKVVEMVRARLGVEVIVEQIRSNPGHYTLNTSSLIKLRQQGVPDKVIAAMQAKRSGGGAAAPADTGGGGAHETPAEASGGAGCRTPGVWELDDVPDRMSGKTQFEVFECERTGDPQAGVIEVTGTCDSGGANFQIVYMSDQKPGIELKQETTGGFGHAKPWVNMRARIDSAAPREVSSEDDYLNYAHLVFVPEQTFSRTDPLSLLLRAKSAGTIEKAARARSILVELTTQNGVRKILELKPQEATFQNFLTRCNRQYWQMNLTGGNGAPQPGPGGTGGRAARNVRALDGFVFVTGPRVYKGTLDGLAAALPGYMERAAATSGLPVRDHAKELAYVMKVARACVEAAPELAEARSNGKYGPLRQKLGCWYHNVSEKVLTPENEPPSLRYWSYYKADARPLMIGIEPLRNEQHRPDWRAGVEIALAYAGLKSDLMPYLAGHPELNPQLTSWVAPGSYTIVDAIIGTGTGAEEAPAVQQTASTRTAVNADAGDGFHFLSTIPMEQKEYNGSVEGFAAKLPAFISRAATASGLPPHDYSKEISYIAEAARGCAGESAGKLGGQSDVCDGRFHAAPREGVVDAKKERTLYFSMKPRGASDGRGLAVEVFFKQMTGDPPSQLPRGSFAQAMQGVAEEYGVVFATISMER